MAAVDLTSVDSKLAGGGYWEVCRQSVIHFPLNVWNFIRNNPRGVKRIVKVAITLSAGIALTINHPLVDIWGLNPFLLGTTVCFSPNPHSTGFRGVETDS